ncbi:MAG: ribonuclease HII [Bacilli bacterium]|jgi:ribonuclease HII|nr:ribonuclease HII [Acholeplasmataceae bacterium]
MMNNYEFEQKVYAEGYQYIAGVDEVGRGPLAGPVVACSIIMPKDNIIEGVTDSKKLTDRKRRQLAEQIKEIALDFQICFIDEEEIDRINILEASKKAMIKAINNHKIQPSYVLVDGVNLKLPIPSEMIIKGDLRSYTIGCASILAKVTRDDYMIKMAEHYPEYGFDRHKGYPTKKHLEAIEKYGVLPIHRRSFKPISSHKKAI